MIDSGAAERTLYREDFAFIHLPSKFIVIVAVSIGTLHLGVALYICWRLV